MQKQKQFVGFLMVLFLIAGIAPALGASASNGGGFWASLISAAQAKDGEDDGGDDNEDDSEDEDEDKNDDSKDKAAKEAEKRAKEAAKQKAEREREIVKKKAEVLRKSTEVKSDDDNDATEEDENETSEERRDDLKKEAADVLEDATEEVIKAEERIARAAAEGIDVSAAQSRLNQAKDKIKALEALINAGTATNKEELRSIAREVKKLAHFASHKDVHSARDAEKDIAKVAKRIAQTEGKIALFQSVGGDGATFTATLNSYKQEFESIKTAIQAGGDGAASAFGSLESIERKIKTLKSSVESALYALGGTDELYDDNYESEIEDIAGDLNDVAEIEGDEVGSVIKALAAEQMTASKTVGETVQSVDDRNVILQSLFGAKLSDIEKLKTEIAANKSRIEKLKAAAAGITDPEVQAILNEQISNLTAETEKLEGFVSGQENRLSALGWFFRLF